MKRKWFDIRAAADETVEILIYDEISSWGITAKDFMKDLAGVTAKSIRLRINSPGGNVFDGVAIHEALCAHPAHVAVQVDGLAASIASVIAMAGDTIHMARNAFIMIHNSWAFAVGDAEEMRKMSDLLDQIDSAMLKTYAARTGSTQRDIRQMMDAETWLSAEDAKAKGFADSVGDAKTKGEDLAAMAQVFDLSKYRNVPAALVAGRDSGKLPTSEREFEQFLRDAGVPGSAARRAVAAARDLFCRDGRSEAALREAVKEGDEETEYALRRCLLAFQQ